MHTSEELFEHGLHCLKQGDRELAREKMGDACLADPNNALAFALRASITYDLSEIKSDRRLLQDVVFYYQRAIALYPSANYYSNMATALLELDRWEDGEKALLEAVSRNPKLAIAWNNLGRTFLVRGRPDESRDAFKRALEADPDYSDAHLGLAFLDLERGDFVTGWEEFEWRRKKLPVRSLAPPWTGQRLADDEAVLLLGEQGLGDTIQFCRYAPLVKKQFGGRVYIEARNPVYRLLQSLEGVDGIISYGGELPPGIKYSSLLMSCPLIFGHFSEDKFPRATSYLKPMPRRVEQLAEYLKAFNPDIPKVGICWAGNSQLPSTDRRRSTNLETWEPLSQAGLIGWVNLQKGKSAEQIHTTRLNMTFLDVMGECEDMADTAALIANCDLVISVDTAVAHLAASLGKPTWVLSRFDACWRWRGDRRDSPWYPTVRHYRQKKFMDWDGLMPEVAADLKKWVEGFHR